jgi:signal transduction histidine kinase
VQALESLKANLLAFYTPEGRRVWGLGYDHDNDQELAMGELSADRLAPGHPLLAPHGEKTVAGLVRTEAGVFLVASRPILTSEGQGPSRGRVIIGRLLNQAAIERFGTQTQVQLQVELLPASEGATLPAEETTAGLVRRTPVQLSVDGGTTRGTVEVADLTGTPLLRFQVDTERAIVALGQATLRYAALSLTAAGGLVLLTLLVFLNQTVFTPIAALTDHARTIGSRGDLNARLSMRRTDEIGTLASEFDIMVERLAETRRQLVEQSYQSGIAEMARGALHNIGNAITPIGVKLINLRRELKQAPLAEMAMASAELADPATPAERRADLAHFTELASAELASLVERTAGELETIRSQVDHAQMILADQQRFATAQRTIEPLVLHRLIAESAELLPGEMLSRMRIEIDENVAAIDRVAATRVALQQVITNLLINAAEAIAAGGQDDRPGLVRIFAGPADPEHPNLAHVCFADNGPGITPEALTHLFERGFTSKARGSGIGLHWCANTMNAMGGRIYATCDGPGRGACLHLLLPLADDNTSTPEAEA